MIFTCYTECFHKKLKNTQKKNTSFPDDIDFSKYKSYILKLILNDVNLLVYEFSCLPISPQ